MPRLRPLIVLGAGLLLTIAVAGCSGDKDSASAAGAAAGGSGQSINLSQSAAKLSTLKSFRFTANASIDFQGTTPSTAEDALGGAIVDMLLDGLKDVKVEGAVVAPDQLELSVKMSGQEFGLIQIGDKAWVRYFGAWQPIEPESLGLEDGFDFSDLAADALPPEVVDAAKVTKDKVNGIEATRYSFDKAALQKLADDVEPGQDVETANMDVWLTDEGVPVKLVVKMKGKGENGEKVDMQLDFALKDLNSNITIKAPQ
ncbi:MAG: hypothetical protein AB7P33_02190 [Dehalococcoidia bacterium]